MEREREREKNAIKITLCFYFHPTQAAGGQDTLVSSYAPFSGYIL